MSSPYKCLLILTGAALIFGQSRPLDNAAILQMVRAHASERAIIAAIATSEPRFRLYPGALDQLAGAGVPQTVIQAMAAKLNGLPVLVPEGVEPAVAEARQAIAVLPRSAPEPMADNQPDTVAMRLPGVAVAVPVAAAPASAPAIAPETWGGTWSATAAKGGLPFQGTWEANLGPDPGTLAGRWTLADSTGKTAGGGTWSAHKSAGGWDGDWQARGMNGQSYTGTWRAQPRQLGSGSFSEMFEYAMTKAVAGDWWMGSANGKWWVKAEQRDRR